MKKRTLMVLTAALVLALIWAVTVMPAFAKQATSGPQHSGQTVTYTGNSTNSKPVSCYQGHSTNPC